MRHKRLGHIENGTENGVNGVEVEAWNTESKEFYIDYTEGGDVGQGAHAEFWLEEGNYTFTFTDPSYGYHRKAFTREVTSDTVETVYLVPGFQNITITGGAVALPYGAEAVYPGWGATGNEPIVVNVTVENQEATTQNTTIIVYAKGINYDGENYKTLINQTATDLAPGENKTLTFHWDTTGVAPSNYIYWPLPGYYTPYNITAVAGDYTDKFCGANVTVRLPGDASCDGHCTGADLGLLGRSWYLEVGHPYYNWRTDYSGDGAVTGADLGILGRNWYKYSETPPLGGGVTKVYVSPPNLTAAVGDIFTVNITVSDVENLYSWSAGITFNASVLRCLGWEEGPFLKQGGDTITMSGTIDNENGTVYPPYGYSLTGQDVVGVNGTGVLASVTFEVIGIGDSYLDLTNVELYNVTLNGESTRIPMEVANGTFEVGHDIAVTNITLSYDTTVVYPTWGGPVEINVTVRNRGAFTETINVTAYYLTFNAVADSYSETKQDGSLAIKSLHPSNNNYYSALGQSIRPTVNCKITSVEVYIRKFGWWWNPTYAYARLYAATGTHGTNARPIGSPLATSQPLDISTLSYSYQLVELTFDTSQQYEMQAETTYIITFGFVTSGTIGEWKYVEWGLDASSPNHPGNTANYRNGAWETDSTKDYCFYVHADVLGEVIGVQPLTLQPLQEETLTFNWTIPKIPPKAYPYPNYTITVNATLVPSDVNPDNNLRVYDDVQVRWPGDADGDGHVNETDRDILYASWYKSYPDPDYDYRADFNGDGKVNGADNNILNRNWGKGPLD